MIQRFKDRYEAGRSLASSLKHLAHRNDVIVLALPRGGVPVAFEVARALEAPMDVFIVRKLGVPGHEELAMGAIAPGDILVLNNEVIRYLEISPAVIDYVARNERRELERRDRLYRGSRPPQELAGRIVILVDDGLATGSTMRAAVSAVRQRRPARIVVAVPVGASSTLKEMEKEADEVVAVLSPEPFEGVGRWYDDFSQTNDDEVRCLLGLSTNHKPGPARAIA